MTAPTQLSSIPRCVLFAGDTAFGESYRARERSRGRVDPIAVYGYGHALSGVEQLLAAADLTILNLETPLIEADHPDAAAAPKRYVHWADGRRTAALLARHGVAAVSLGNNHAADRGAGGLRHTLATLARAGIDAFGAGLHEAEATRPFHRRLDLGSRSLSLTVLGGKHRWRRDDPEPFAHGVTTGLNEWTRSRATAQIAAERERDPDAFIVAFPHWGSNYRWRASRQQRLAHAIIDAGADLIVGHGAHMIQEIERYRERLIVYGLGNFAFASPGRFQKVAGAVPFGAAAMLAFTPEPEGVHAEVRLYPLWSDNRVTGYQPRPVSAKQMDEVIAALAQRPPAQEHPAHAVTTDDLGPHLRLDLGIMPVGRAVPSTGALMPAATVALRSAS